MQNDGYANRDSSNKTSSISSTDTPIPASPITLFDKDKYKKRSPGFWMHYRLLLWKSFILRRRQPIALFGEFFLPLILIFVIMGLRFSQEAGNAPPCHVFSQPLPSMGILSYTRGMICNFNLDCTNQPEEGRIPDWLSINVDKLTQIFTIMSSNKTAAIDIVCDPATLTLIRHLFPHSMVDEIETSCKLPMPFRDSLVSVSLIHIAINQLSMIEQKQSTLSTQGMIRRASIFFCGSSKGGNSILGLLDMIKKAGEQKMRSYTKVLQKDPKEEKPLDLCAIVESLYQKDTTRPYISRIYAFLRLTVLYHPVNAFTNAVVKKANTTAIMLSRLKEIISDYESEKQTLIPDIMAKSEMVKLFRSLTIVCQVDPGLSAEMKAICKQVNTFLKPSLDVGDTSPHWSKFVAQLNNITQLIDTFLSTCINYDRFRAFENKTEMEAETVRLFQEKRPVIMVLFDSVPSSNSTLFSLVFRIPNSLIDGTLKFKVLDRYWHASPRKGIRNSMFYFTSGFIDLQESIERAYISLLMSPPAPNTSLYANDLLATRMKMVPNPCFQGNPIISLFSSNIPMMVVVVWICSAVITTRSIVYEKEMRLKEFTKVMGMNNLVHWLNWLTVGLVIMGSTALVACILLKFGRIFPNSEFFLLFCIFLAYIFALIPQCFFVSVFFSNSNLAAVFSGIFYFIMFIPYNLVLLYDLSYNALAALSLFPQVALAMAFTRVGSLEVQGFGAQWGTLWVNKLSNDEFSLGNCMLMLLVDGVLASICVFYLELVLPNNYGVPLPCYFPLTRSYWRGLFGKIKGVEVPRNSDRQSAQIEDPFYEKSEEGLSVGVSVQGLTKCYHGSKTPALNNLWVDFYEGQITSFLGHNGAGKTTTISILTGIYAPSAGTAYIYGKNLTKEMPEIRRELGLCPQHNVLFDNMTVKEHLIFYGFLKGLNRQEVKDEVKVFLSELNLEEKANEKAKSLSGGQKRRLSLAAAFVGGSKIVFLDEPTAGVDPHSRRNIWNLIFRFKQSRTIILTTHHMDEADILGDRIVIISQGHVKASGSSLFLKSNFAKHYYLCLEKKVETLKTLDAELAKEIVLHLPGSELLTSNATEWVFSLPAAEIYNDGKGGFVHFFTWLEGNKEDLARRFGIQQIGLTDTNLEEIFILLSDDPSSQKGNILKRSRKFFFLKKYLLHHRKQRALRRFDDIQIEESDENEEGKIETAQDLGEGEPWQNTDSQEEEEEEGTNIDNIFVERQQGFAVYWQQFRAYIVKRFHCTLRSKIGWLLEIVFPALTVLLLMIVGTAFPIDTSQIFMPIHPWLMAAMSKGDHLETFFENNVNTTGTVPQMRPLIETYSRQMLTKSGWAGTRCLPHSVYKIIPAAFDTCSADYRPPSSPPSLTLEEIAEVNASKTKNCACGDNGKYICPAGAVIKPPQVKLATNDILQNLTYYDLEDYLVKSRNQAILKRYGGLSLMANRNHANIVRLHEILSNKLLLETVFNYLFNNANATRIALNLTDFMRDGLPPPNFAQIWYHNKGYAASTAYLNVLHNLQLRLLLSDRYLMGRPRNDFGMAIANHPLTQANEKAEKQIMNTIMLSLFKSIGTLLALSFVPASFATFLIRERVLGSKDLQFLSGQNRLVYWLSSYVWDFANFCVSCIIVIIIFFIFKEQAFIRQEHVGGFIALLVSYGFCIIPCMYMFTFAFRIPSVAFVALLAGNLMIAIITTVTVYMLDLVGKENEAAMKANDVLKMVFLVFPQFAFGRGFFEFSMRQAIDDFDAGQIVPLGSLYAWENLSSKLASLLIEAVIFLGIVLMLEYSRTWSRCKLTGEAKVTPSWFVDEEDVDPDVAAERLRVINDPENKAGDVIRALNLMKRYSRKKQPAVNNLTFGVRKGECFGLLGVNGAGKTTTFNMLTTSLRPNNGEIRIIGSNPSESTAPISTDQIGYCPQFDALLPLLTGYETLQLYARIRSFPENDIDRVIKLLLKRLGLEPYAHKAVSSYSGGNLRKLSTAVATIGKPRVLLLDEPTSGMDPGAKRRLWEEIKYLLCQNCSVVLTSHSMEECEALCNRLAIMVDGQFQCFGTVSRLKERFGEGYILELDAVSELVEGSGVLSPLTQLPGLVISEQVGKRIIFQADSSIPLFTLFRLLNELKNKAVIKAFAVRQASLDNVFVNFVRLHERENSDDDTNIGF